MFLGGIAQGYSQGLLANEQSADRAELLKQRKLDTERKEAEALQAQIEKANLSSAQYKDQLAELKAKEQGGAALPVPSQQPSQMPQPPSPGQASVPNPMNQGQAFQRPPMQPPMQQGMPPPMSQQQMQMGGGMQQPPNAMPRPIPPYVDPNKMQASPPMTQQRPPSPPMQQSGQQPPQMQQGQPQPIKIGDMVIETPVAKSTLMEDIKRFKANGYTQDEIRAVLNRDKMYYEAIGNAEKEANMAAQQAYMDKMAAVREINTERHQNVQEKETARYHDQEHRDRMAKIAEGNSSAAKPAQNVIDYYAKQSLAGDNSWQVGLARGKVGQQLISAVKDRIPQLAKEENVSPEEASSRKGQRDALNSTLKDRTKNLAVSTQFINNFNKQSEIVDKYIEKGAAGGTPIVNKWIQAGRKSVAGDPDVTAFDTAIRGLAREHQRIVTGVTSNAQLHASAQETADSLLNKDMTPEQIKSTMKVMLEEAKNAKDSGTDEVEFLKTQLKTMGISGNDNSSSKSDKPQKGDVMDGYKFNGGNPSDKNNWTKV